MAITYDSIATTTLGSTATTISFTSIPSTYTDLRLVVVGGDTVGGVVAIRFNTDTATNYSRTRLNGDGAAASSSKQASVTYIGAGVGSPSSPNLGFYSFDIFSYAGSTYKTTLNTASEDNNGSGSVARDVGLWRSTAAITSITVGALQTSGTMATGTVFTLYGIKAA